MYASDASFSPLSGYGLGALPPGVPTYQEYLEAPGARPGERAAAYPTEALYNAYFDPAPDLLNAGQWGTDVGAIGHNFAAGGSSWIQRHDGTIEDAFTGQELERVPGSSTREEAAAAAAILEEYEEAESDPIPDGFYLDPEVEAEWERQNAGAGGAGDELDELDAGVHVPLLAGLGLLGLFLIARPRSR